MKEIPLTQGKVALVDDEDFDVLNAFKWCAHRGGRTFYADRSIPRSDGSQATEIMHRVILERKLGCKIPNGITPDHENGNGLDNRRTNLRQADAGQQGRSCRRKSANPSSRFLGVSWYRPSGKWRAQIRVHYRLIHLGYHDTERSAMVAREAYIACHPELQARSNVPKEAP